ncbi:ABC transporter permease [Nonomuraea guangzhouensis]|uniref:ABC transporter permease n=1 Tax=Nonomuraea guangzhouensis TaxID=1291555 RepID=A0ABW4GUF3_9ACTN|nr:ABC transporter permease [Nonomuraea guangzhouensis]
MTGPLSVLRAARPGRWQAQSSAGVGLVLTAPALILVGGLVAYPLTSLVIDTLGPEGRAALVSVLTAGASRQALLRTLWVSFEVTALAVVLGAFMAWALCTVRSRLWRVVLWIAVLAPFWMSVVVKNYAFVLILRQGGPLNRLLVTLGLMDSQQSLLYTEGSVIVGMLYAMLPYAVLPLFATFSGVDRSLISAAETLGAGRARAITSVVLPLAARGIVAAATLVYVICLGFYVTPVVLGGPGTPFVATMIGSYVFEYFDMPGAKAFALVILLAALAAVVAGQALSRLLPSAGDR